MDELSILNIANVNYEISDTKARNQVVTSQSTKIPTIFYTIVGDMVLVDGEVKGNDTALIDLGIPELKNAVPVILRISNNAQFLTVYCDNSGKLSGWDGWNDRTFSSSYIYQLSFVAKLK